MAVEILLSRSRVRWMSGEMWSRSLFYSLRERFSSACGTTRWQDAEGTETRDEEGIEIRDEQEVEN